MKHSIFKWLKTLMIGLSLMLSAGAAQAVPTTDPSTLLLSGFNEAGWIKQADEYIKTLERYTNQFTQAATGDFSTLMASYGLGGGSLSKDSNRAVYDKFISDYQKNNKCDRMSSKQQMAKSLCDARHNIEVARFKKLAEMLDYTDQKNEEIKNALKKADAINGKDNAGEKNAALLQVQTLQNNLKDGVKQYTDQILGYDAQIGIIKSQQAEVARIALQGKPPGLLGAAVSAAMMKGVFSAIKH